VSHAERDDPGAGSPIPGFAPQTELERRLLEEPDLRAGLAWGRPRPGHPEGAVGSHVADLLRTIDEDGESGERRRLLRFMAIVHDAFKDQVKSWLPKTGGNHHAVRARRFAERFTDDERALAAIEHHDRPYAIWRKMKRSGSLDEGRFQAMMDRIPDPHLFLRFIEIDGGTEGKKPEPIRWFRDELRRRGIVGH
jgi:HD domain